MSAFGAILAIRRGDLGALERWHARLSGLEGALPSYLNHIPACVPVAVGDNHAAAERMRLLYDKAVEDGLRTRQLKCRINQALAASGVSEKLKFIVDALLIGQPEGFIRSFVDEAGQLEGLLRSALRRGVTPEYTARLIRIMEEKRSRQSGTGALPEIPSASGPLSDREKEILRLLATGLSNRDISVRLFLTVGTVNVHVHNILGKLQARSRTQAVSIARELKLV